MENPKKETIEEYKRLRDYKYQSKFEAMKNAITNTTDIDELTIDQIIELRKVECLESISDSLEFLCYKIQNPNWWQYDFEDKQNE